MMYHPRWALTLCAGLVLAACDGGVDPEVLAVAQDHELTIDEAVELISSQNQLPNNPNVVEAVADLWIDYTLLAQAALGDSLLESIDITPLVRRQVEQDMVFRLRNEAIQIDTVVSDEELESLWVASGPDGTVSARHILLSYPEDATDAQRDSVQALATSLKARAEAGEDFGDLARRYSADRGTAELGGDLGTFGRGQMLAPFENAAFALQPGEISDPVETIYGVHVILLDSADLMTLEDAETRAGFLGQVLGARTAAAESLYIAGIEEPANVRVQAGATAAVKEIAARPGQRLSPRAARRALAEYERGEYTAGEFQEFVQGQAPGFRQGVGQADSAALDGLLRRLVSGELLVMTAADAGLTPEQAILDSLDANARSQMRMAAGQLGLLGITPGEGQTPAEAVEERVMGNLQEILQGRRDVIPLGVIAYTLRQRYRAEVSVPAIDETVARIGAVGQRPAAPPPSRAPNAPPPPAADTTGA